MFIYFINHSKTSYNIVIILYLQYISCIYYEMNILLNLISYIKYTI